MTKRAVSNKTDGTRDTDTRQRERREERAQTDYCLAATECWGCWIRERKRITDVVETE